MRSIMNRAIPTVLHQAAMGSRVSMKLIASRMPAKGDSHRPSAADRTAHLLLLLGLWRRHLRNRVIRCERPCCRGWRRRGRTGRTRGTRRPRRRHALLRLELAGLRSHHLWRAAPIRKVSLAPLARTHSQYSLATSADSVTVKPTFGHLHARASGHQLGSMSLLYTQDRAEKRQQPLRWPNVRRPGPRT